MLRKGRLIRAPPRLQPALQQGDRAAAEQGGEGPRPAFLVDEVTDGDFQQGDRTGQSRERQHAEAARQQAQDNLALAKQRQKEASEAREEEAAAKQVAEKRAEELETVTEFQASMLSDIDAQQMGRNIVEDLRNQIEAAFGDEATSGNSNGSAASKSAGTSSPRTTQ